MQPSSNLKLCQPCEGQLYKYTNVMKGWQYRWFVLNPDKGTFEYYLSDSDKLQTNRPRGALHLAGAVISPSEEDSHTFVVNSASGDVYKLRAADAKERQLWITRLRIVAERHSHALAQTNSPLVQREHGTSTARMVPTNLSILDAFAQVQEWLQKAEVACQEVGISIDRFPISGPGIKSTDPDLLILKATTQTTLGNLQECLYALQMQQRATVKAEMQAASQAQSSSSSSAAQGSSSSSQSHLSSLSSSSSGYHHQHHQQQQYQRQNQQQQQQQPLQSYSSPSTLSSSTPVTPTSASFSSHRASSSVSTSSGGARSVHFSAN